MLFTPDTIFSPTAIGPLGNITILVTSTFRNEMIFFCFTSEGYLLFNFCKRSFADGMISSFSS